MFGPLEELILRPRDLHTLQVGMAQFCILCQQWSDEVHRRSRRHVNNVQALQELDPEVQQDVLTDWRTQAQDHPLVIAWLPRRAGFTPSVDIKGKLHYKMPTMESCNEDKQLEIDPTESMVRLRRNGQSEDEDDGTAASSCGDNSKTLTFGLLCERSNYLGGPETDPKVLQQKTARRCSQGNQTGLNEHD